MRLACVSPAASAALLPYTGATRPSDGVLDTDRPLAISLKHNIHIAVYNTTTQGAPHIARPSPLHETEHMKLAGSNAMANDAMANASAANL